MEGLSPCEPMVRAMAKSESIKVNPSEVVVQHKTEPRLKGKSMGTFLLPKRGLVKKTVFGDIAQFIGTFRPRKVLRSYFRAEPQVINKPSCKKKKKFFMDKDGIDQSN